ncbi:MAG: hypothetical protein IPO09_04425 [Anaeromyxobacter sp.]|nr:hypothetical protein [Anaeromyxobacter sp.]MBL0275830.1 hypothetical protein [Anaeromyxobacter sp.]
MHVGWNQSLATGIEEIDAHQLELFRRATHLVEAARSRRAPETRAHLARLAEVAVVLFETEERTLREVGAPSLERHALEHRRFLDDLEVVSHELARRGADALVDLGVARFVASWLEAHVSGTDRDLGQAAGPEASA